MNVRRVMALTLCAALGWFALAQPSTVEELAHALNTDAFVTEEPLGEIVDCAPYEDVLPDMSLACFELYMPKIVIRGRFGTYVSEVEAFSWLEEEWADIAIDELPPQVDPEDDHIRRTIVAPSGATFTISIFDVGFSSHIVVASEGE